MRIKNIRTKGPYPSLFRGIFTGLIFLTFLQNCTNPVPELPLPKEKVVQIIKDVHFAQSAVQSVYGLAKDSLLDHYYQQIYKIHDIDSLQLSELIKLLRNNPLVLQDVYGTAIREIEASGMD